MCHKGWLGKTPAFSNCFSCLVHLECTCKDAIHIIRGISSAELVWDIQETHQNGVVLIYRGYVYIFSRDNQLITVYRNQRISL